MQSRHYITFFIEYGRNIVASSNRGGTGYEVFDSFQAKTSISTLLRCKMHDFQETNIILNGCYPFQKYTGRYYNIRLYCDRGRRYCLLIPAAKRQQQYYTAERSPCCINSILTNPFCSFHMKKDNKQGYSSSNDSSEDINNIQVIILIISCHLLYQKY